MFSSPASICSSLDIEIIPTSVRPGKNQTCADATMAAVFKQYGPGHLTLVLRTIVESVGNERALKAPIILAVSDLVATQPSWAGLGLRWIEAFDSIDLMELMHSARSNKKAVPLRAGICTLVFERLSLALGRPARTNRKMLDDCQSMAA